MTDEPITGLFGKVVRKAVERVDSTKNMYSGVSVERIRAMSMDEVYGCCPFPEAIAEVEKHVPEDRGNWWAWEQMGRVFDAELPSAKITAWADRLIAQAGEQA